MGRQATRYRGVYARELADGTTVYDCVWDAGPDPKSGKRRKPQKRGFKTAREADRYRRDRLAEVERGTYVETSRTTIGGYLDDWLDRREPNATETGGRGHRGKLSIGGWETYRRYTDAYVKPSIGSVKLQDLTPAHLEHLYDELERSGGRAGEGLSAKTISNLHGLLHKALKDAVKRGQLVRNVADAVDAPKADKPDTDWWEPTQLRTFLAHVRDERLYAAWLLFSTTGMRRGEVAGLAWDDLDLDAGTVTVEWQLGVISNKATWKRRPKSEAGERRMSLDPATVEALKAWWKVQAEERLAFGPGYTTVCEDWRGNAREGVVFTWPDGTLIHPERWTKWFTQLSTDCGLPRIRLHDVRHSYATAALSSATGWAEVKVLSKRLGHASVGITLDTYSHVLPDQDAEMANTLARHILGDVTTA